MKSDGDEEVAFVRSSTFDNPLRRLITGSDSFFFDREWAHYCRRGKKEDHDLYMLPPPSGKTIDVNMMPVNLWALDTSLPEDLRQYANLIGALPIVKYDLSTTKMKPKIVYLTVQEGKVPVGRSQRRPGVHIERPASIGGGEVSRGFSGFKKSLSVAEKKYLDLAWGLGSCPKGVDIPVDGIYVATSVSDSCAVWPALIDKPECVTDAHGGVEPLRPFLGDPVLLQAGEVCWMTDRTPHASLPLRAPDGDPAATHVFRQFFRLVAGPVSVWYAKHNTPNPTGTQPDAPCVSVNKF